MKTLLLALALIGSAVAAETPKEKAKDELIFPIPEMKLTNGRVWKNVTVVRYEKDNVVLKSSAGIGPIPYSYVPEPTRGLMLTARDAPTPAAKPVVPTPVEMVTHTGQAFIVTQGAGNYKLGAMTVYVLPPEAAKQFESVFGTVQLPKPLATAITDADGKFHFSLPKGQAGFLFAQGRRSVGRYDEIYEWRVSFGAANTKPILLSRDHHDRHTPVRFEN